MRRFWALENAFLEAFAQQERDDNRRRNRLLLSAVLFGGLLNPGEWKDWVRAVMGRIRPLEDGKGLPADETRFIYIGSTQRAWFADPITRNLLARPRPALPPRALATPRDDYPRLLGLDERALFGELEEWVLPAARVKAALLWPPLVVEHCSGELGSQSLPTKRWNTLLAAGLPTRSLGPVEMSEPVERKQSGGWIVDKGFGHIRAAIFKAISTYAASQDPKLSVEREALRTSLAQSRKRHLRSSRKGGSLGRLVHDWFLQHCPARRLPQGRRPTRYLRARTLADYVFALGLRVDWSDIWHLSIPEIGAEAVKKKLQAPGVPQAELDDVDPQRFIEYAADRIQDKLYAAVKHQPDKFHIARRLYSFLGFGTLPRPSSPAGSRPRSGVKRQILTGPEFQAVLGQLRCRDGSPGAHWLAAVLMFRCGLRAREVIALEIDQVTVVDGIVELKVAATPYVELKNRTSRRVLPLHALLEPPELAELLKWRARRVRESRDCRNHARFLFEKVFRPSDYDHLLDPIETAIRRACGEPPLPAEERISPAYIFSRGSVLRHSFVSYALGSLLMPPDADGLAMPPGITPDLVSLARRNRLERALLAEDHLGLSSVEALRQLVGHSSFRRTLGTYAHLMDLVAWMYSWRRAAEPSMPAAAIEALAGGQRRAEALVRSATAATDREWSAFGKAVQSLRQGGALARISFPRARRRRAQRVAPWEPAGNAFLSQLQPQSVQPPPDGALELPEWRSDDLSDWRTVDLVLQMSSRGVPARLVADEVGVRPDAVARLARRYHQLLVLRRRGMPGSEGKLRHAVLLEHPADAPVAFDEEEACWYAPLRRLPPDHMRAIDAIWRQLRERRTDSEAQRWLRTYVSTHRDGRIQRRNAAALQAMAAALNSVLAGGEPPVTRAVVRSPKAGSQGPFHELRLQPRRGERRVAHAMLLHLILMAEAASSQRLPKALLSAPKPLGRTHVELRLENWRAEMARARRKQEKAARKAIERAERQATRQKEAERERARIERRELRKSCLNQYPVTVVRIRRRLPKRPSAAEIPGARDAFRERVDAPGLSESQA